VQEVDVAALAAHDGAAVVAVDVLDVEREGLRGACGGLVQQSPQRLLAHRDVVASPQAFELVVRDRAGPVRWLATTFDAHRDIGGQPVVALAEADEGAGGRDVAVPRGGRARSPCSEQHDGEQLGVQLDEQAIIADVGRDPVQSLAVGTLALNCQISAGEERRNRVPESPLRPVIDWFHRLSRPSSQGMRR